MKTQEKKEEILENTFEGAQMMDLATETFRQLLEIWKETTFKDVGARWLWYKKHKKKLQKELDVNSGVEKYNNWKAISLDGLCSRFECAEEKSENLKAGP